MIIIPLAIVLLTLVVNSHAVKMLINNESHGSTSVTSAVDVQSMLTNMNPVTFDTVWFLSARDAHSIT